MLTKIEIIKSILCSSGLSSKKMKLNRTFVKALGYVKISDILKNI